MMKKKMNNSKLVKVVLDKRQKLIDNADEKLVNNIGKRKFNWIVLVLFVLFVWLVVNTGVIIGFMIHPQITMVKSDVYEQITQNYTIIKQYPTKVIYNQTIINNQMVGDTDCMCVEVKNSINVSRQICDCRKK